MALVKAMYSMGKTTRGIHPTKQTYRPFVAWKSMLRRCYYEPYLIENINYRGCIVCAEWLDYQVFADWFTKQVGFTLGWELDKDLLANKAGISDKIYSPDYCVLLSKRLNAMLITNTRNKNNFPVGVTLTKSGRYTAHCKDANSKTQALGTFTTVADASIAYQAYKKVIFKSIVDIYKDDLEPETYLALINYTA